MIVFLTVYLGLITGRQPFELRVDPAVKLVRFYLDGQKVDALGAPPWRTIVDLGNSIKPHELVAQGLDEKGEEIARVSQIINLPRPTAELEVVLDRDEKGVPKRVTLTGFHVSYSDVRRATLKLDLVPLKLDRSFSATLPAVDMRRPHDLAAEMRFADGTVARREVVFGGEFAETMPTQLTPTAVTMRVAGNEPPADCFVNHGEPLRVSNVEKPGATLIVVRDPDPAEVKGALMFSAVVNGRIDTNDMRRASMLDADTAMELMSPAADRVVEPDRPTAILFPSFENTEAKIGLYWFLTSTKIRGTAVDAPRRWADAVAVAAVKAISSGHRRAVLLVLGNKPDTSYHAPEAVREYLASVGVPLFVWSVFGNSDIGAHWGTVEDVSTMEKMAAATEKIRNALDVQRIAWIYADPFTALHAEVKDGCGYARLAR
ncbi:MAG TPA: hypothetical protein VJZ76_07255 [Thermoanaerobaculia bacterium]|nr:hypothetical protein [Thermoanaerobaculia bacterium]